MSSADHLFQPDNHRILQYSGFHREGGNPDRLHFLYEENGWQVVADHQGPGVISRIWATHGEEWKDIRIELDGKVIFEGRADLFFKNNQYPFSPPLNEIRTGRKGGADQFGEAGTPAQIRYWGVSYLPLPFKSRFRYMQRGQLYTNIEVKQLQPDTPVESFNDVNWEEVRPEWEKAVAIWNRNSLYGDELKNYQKVSSTLNFSPVAKHTPDTRTVLHIDGPGIIRSIRVKVVPEVRKQISLQAFWDSTDKPSIDVSLDVGFGSRDHHTLAIGQSDDGWQFLNFPMPFRKSALIQFASLANVTTSIDIEIYYEENDSLPLAIMYLNSFQHRDKFLKDQNVFLFPDVPKKEFLYYNGYTAVDLVGIGHIVAYMDLYQSQPELDEHIFIDGERMFPENSWNGTGHEDLFDMAWGHKMHSAPMTSGGSETQEETNVRLFWNNTMTFREDIRWNWEWSFKLDQKPPRDAIFKSVVYWYSRPGGSSIMQPPIYYNSE